SRWTNSKLETSVDNVSEDKSASFAVLGSPGSSRPASCPSNTSKQYYTLKCWLDIS
ncbi:hypothetical protein J6590_106330, partial [Homalodisca vitripennis]